MNRPVNPIAAVLHVADLASHANVGVKNGNVGRGPR